LVVEDNAMILLGGLFWMVGTNNLVLWLVPSLRRNAQIRTSRQGFRPITNVDAAFQGSIAFAFGYVWLAKACGWPHPEWGAYAIGGFFTLLVAGGIICSIVESKS
jgi:hypothetical protein